METVLTAYVAVAVILILLPWSGVRMRMRQARSLFPMFIAAMILWPLFEAQNIARWKRWAQKGGE